MVTNKNIVYSVAAFMLCVSSASGSVWHFFIDEMKNLKVCDWKIALVVGQKECMAAKFILGVKG